MSPLAKRLRSLAEEYRVYVDALEESPHARPESVTRYRQAVADLERASVLASGRNEP